MDPDAAQALVFKVNLVFGCGNGDDLRVIRAADIALRDNLRYTQLGPNGNVGRQELAILVGGISASCPPADAVLLILFNLELDSFDNTIR